MIESTPDVVCARGARRRALLVLGAVTLAALAAAILLRNDRNDGGPLADVLAAAESMEGTTARLRVALHGDGETPLEYAGQGAIDFARSRFAFTVEDSELDMGLVIDVRSDGRRLYLKFFERPWAALDVGQALDGGLTEAMINPAALLELLESDGAVRQATSLGRRQVDGADVDAYRVILHAASVQEQFKAPAGEGRFDDPVLEFFVDDDGLIRRQAMMVRHEGTSRTVILDFTELGADVAVEMPPEDQVRPVDSVDSLNDPPAS